MQAGKVEALRRILPEHLAKGDRVLLFSQFTQVLDILEAVLFTMGIRYLKLTGQTNVTERQGLVDEFYADEDIGVFLLSTRAGGLGINLAVRARLRPSDCADVNHKGREYRHHARPGLCAFACCGYTHDSC
jgi:SNF2 family DNA or RNA helicase